MANIFKLPVEWNGQEIEYPAEIVHQGYTHKVIVDIDGALVTFEQDEEGNYRALIELNEGHNIPPLLLKEISDTLAVLFS